MANEGPSLTKATYDKKRTRKPAPSPIQRQAALEEKMRDSATSKRALQQATKVGIRRSTLSGKGSAEGTDQADQATYLRFPDTTYCHRPDAVVQAIF